MKKLIKGILILLMCFSIKNVYAENYKIKELIPYGVDTTIHTNNFSYKGIYFDNEAIHFNGIKNLTKERLPISISVGLFNKKGKNIGVINYCDMYLDGETEMSFIIRYSKDYLGERYNKKDIKYIAVLGDNITCKTKGSRDFIGQSVDQMGVSHSEKFDDQTNLFLSILAILGGALIVFILYKLLFTKSYKNINGNTVRKSYEKINKELKEKREKELRDNPPVVKKNKMDKPVEILQQEEDAKKEDKSSTDLHNLYK